MSSHHIVRENQEPALLINYYEAIDQEYLGQLLEWSPTIITDEDNVDYLLAEDIKVDILVGDAALLPSQEQIKHIPLKTSLLEDALAYLVAHNYKAVNILLHDISANILRFAEYINIVCFANGRRYVIVNEKYEKWKPKGEYVYLDENRIKSFTGLTIVSPNTFVTIEDGFFSLEFNSTDFVFIGEDI